MNRNKLFLNSSLQKQRNFSAEPESSAATACIAHKSLRICERCRLALFPIRLPATGSYVCCLLRRDPPLFCCDMSAFFGDGALHREHHKGERYSEHGKNQEAVKIR